MYERIEPFFQQGPSPVSHLEKHKNYYNLKHIADEAEIRGEAASVVTRNLLKFKPKVYFSIVPVHLTLRQQIGLCLYLIPRLTIVNLSGDPITADIHGLLGHGQNSR
jgi:hypothetical protein